LDILDVRIVREFAQDRGMYPLQSDIRQSSKKVAGKLKIDEATVRYRIRNLRGSGFLRSWYVIPNPGLSLLKVAHIRLDIPQVRSTTKQDVIRKIKLIEGVWMVTNHFGSSMRVVLCFGHEASLKKQIELIAEISNCDDLLYREIHFPRCTIELTEHDLMLVTSIQTDPTKPYDGIARETGMSNKTAKRRLERMIRGRALFVIPSFAPRALDGAMLAELFVVYDGPENTAGTNDGIASHLDQNLVSAQLGDPEHTFFLLVITNISQVNEILDWVRQQPGVKSAFMDLVEERIEQYEALGQQLLATHRPLV
jgi:DNA-binding Lrp family transcriptional regulator